MVLAVVRTTTIVMAMGIAEPTANATVVVVVEIMAVLQRVQRHFCTLKQKMALKWTMMSCSESRQVSLLQSKKV